MTGRRMGQNSESLGILTNSATALPLQIFRVRRTSSPSIVPVPDGLEVRRTTQHDPNFKLSQSTTAPGILINDAADLGRNSCQFRDTPWDLRFCRSPDSTKIGCLGCCCECFRNRTDAFRRSFVSKIQSGDKSPHSKVALSS